MAKLAWIFPGQGAQYSGMGRELTEGSEKAKEIFEAAERILPGITELCFSGAEEELKRTKNAQPAIFLTEMAAAAALREAGFQPDCTAGFSLGEWSAVATAGLLPFTDCFSLVTKRGELMEQAAAEAPAFMAAVLRLDTQKVQELCRSFSRVYPVNYNCPGQISVSGSREEEADFLKAVKEAGGRAIPLKVSGGFHSPFMEQAGEAFYRELSAYLFREISALHCPLYSNQTGEMYSGDVKKLLSLQISSPVQWESIVRNMISEGVDTFVELGPGNTLSGMVQRIDSSVRVLRVENQETLRSTIDSLRSTQ